MKLSGPEFITVGKITAPWGNNGKLKVAVLTDFPERFSPNSKVHVMQHPMTISSTAWHKGTAIIKLDGINSVAEAEKLRGEVIEIHQSQLKTLAEGQYYHFQLIGLEVWTTTGELLGNITDILSAPSNDNYVVSGDRGEILIPAISDVVKSVDLDKGKITIELINGLLDLKP